ncbi:mechanosensitive ion channel family protein [Bordetella petrii]|uniref:mechanosensitive ion channel family protein n=1 Tax=Bordetella petrii TaxID=94624 RepID=UPI001E444DD6|nr:mechanosensitive ion channel family protein [Bordetella petrii]MCD0503344.1 mechanosensitive ion channel family protein [Bordetella petrii]
MDAISDFFSGLEFLGIPAANWLLAAVLALVVFVAARLAVSLLVRRLQSGTRAATQFTEVISIAAAATSNTLLALASILVGAGVLDLPARWADRVSSLWFVVAVLQVALWAHRAVGLGLLHCFRTHATAQGTQVGALASLSVWGAKVLLWTIVLLAMLSNMGVNITAFVASLGVGGIALALAVQNILGDLFASLSIAVDKPFEVGDFIVVNSQAGTVEHVGLKTTRIRSLGGEQIVMSNTKLLGDTIQNFKRLQERRIVFKFGLTYDCTPAQLRQVPAIVQDIIQSQAQTRFDRCHFMNFGDSSLDFEVVYIVLDPGYNVYMDIQQSINIAMIEKFADIGAEFAFPTRTLYMAPQGPAPADPA